MDPLLLKLKKIVTTNTTFYRIAVEKIMVHIFLKTVIKENDLTEEKQSLKGGWISVLIPPPPL